MRPLLAVAGYIDRLNDGMYAMIRWLTLAMILVGAYNAIARYVTRWTGMALASNAYFDMQWYMFSVIFLLGAAYALNHDVHVRVDVIYSRLGGKARAWIDVLGTLFFLIPFCVLMLVTSYPAVRNSWAVREMSPDPGGLPRYPLKTLILVCFALLLLQAFAQLIKKVAVLRDVLPPEQAEDPTPPDAGPDMRYGQIEGT
jgi:TRAP-type mannitol/chloroaromatic compound transport system permease small subunit